MCEGTDVRGVEQMTRHSRIEISPFLNGLLTISQGHGIRRLLFEEPRGKIVTWAKDARIRKRWRGERATEEEGGDCDGEEASEYHYEQAGSHGGWEERKRCKKTRGPFHKPEVLTGAPRARA